MSLKNTVKELLDEAGDNTLQSAFFHQEIGHSYCKEDDDLEAKLDSAGINYECVEQHGGEGEGDQYWTVYKFTKDGEQQFVKFNGWYQSYNGSEMTEYSFVTPKKVEVIVYG